MAGPRARGLEAGAQLVGREEAAVRGDLGEGEVRGPGDVPGHRVDRLDLASVALGRAGVEEQALRVRWSGRQLAGLAGVA